VQSAGVGRHPAVRDQFLTGAGNVRPAQAEEGWCAWVCVAGAAVCCIWLPEICLDLCLEGGGACIDWCNSRKT
jgi:hypothetical protein